MAASSALAGIDNENVISTVNIIAENVRPKSAMNKALMDKAPADKTAVGKNGLTVEVCVTFDKLILLRLVSLSAKNGTL